MWTHTPAPQQHPRTLKQKAGDLAAVAGATVLVAYILTGLGDMLDGTRAAMRGTPGERAAWDQLADDNECRRLHGSRARADYLPNGEHRCVDSDGRRLRSQVEVLTRYSGDL